MSLPRNVKDVLLLKMSQKIAAAGWRDLPPAKKTVLLDAWLADPELGGVVSRYMPHGKTRTYLKDVLVRKSQRAKPSELSSVLAQIGVDPETPAQQRFVKPNGVRLSTGGIVCWGRARDWKVVLLSCHERAMGCGEAPCGIVLTDSAALLHTPQARRIVEVAAEKLGVASVGWIHGPA